MVENVILCILAIIVILTFVFMIFIAIHQMILYTTISEEQKEKHRQNIIRYMRKKNKNA
jgi:glycerol-3-phosphate acyltransferase PlsY